SHVIVVVCEGLEAWQRRLRDDAGLPIHHERLMPGAAVGTDLQREIVRADETEFGARRKAGLQEQRQHIGGALLVERVTQVAIPAFARAASGPQGLVQLGGEDVLGVGSRAYA